MATESKAKLSEAGYGVAWRGLEWSLLRQEVAECSFMSLMSMVAGHKDGDRRGVSPSCAFHTFCEGTGLGMGRQGAEIGAWGVRRVWRLIFPPKSQVSFLYRRSLSSPTADPHWGSEVLVPRPRCRQLAVPSPQIRGINGELTSCFDMARKKYTK